MPEARVAEGCRELSGEGGSALAEADDVGLLVDDFERDGLGSGGAAAGADVPEDDVGAARGGCGHGCTVRA